MAGTLGCSGNWEKTRAKLRPEGESVRLAPASSHPVRQLLILAGATVRQRRHRTRLCYRSTSSGHSPAGSSVHPSADLSVAAGHHSGLAGVVASDCCFRRILAARRRCRLLGCPELLPSATPPTPLRLLVSRCSPPCRRFLLLPVPFAVRAMVCGGLRPGVR